MDLSTWSLHHYHVSGWKVLLVNLGANPYRCEHCRHNFVSLRRRKYRFNHPRGRSQDDAAEVPGPTEE